MLETIMAQLAVAETLYQTLENHFQPEHPWYVNVMVALIVAAMVALTLMMVALFISFIKDFVSPNIFKCPALYVLAGPEGLTLEENKDAALNLHALHINSHPDDLDLGVYEVRLPRFLTGRQAVNLMEFMDAFNVAARDEPLTRLMLQHRAIIADISGVSIEEVTDG